MRELKYEIINLKKFTNRFKLFYYSKLLTNHYDFLVIKTPQKLICLTKECTTFEITNFEEFIKKMQKYIYFSTKITQNTSNFENLDIFLRLIKKYKHALSKKYLDYLFGSVAVRSGDGFITSVRGKKDLNGFTYIKDVNFEKKEILAYNQKATLNAPLLAHLLKNKDVFAVVHLHKEIKKYPTLPYHPAGTICDSIRPNKFSFNIDNHGVCLLLDKNLKIITHKKIVQNEKYPTYKEYEHLYKRFFKRESDELVGMVDIKNDSNVIDLCGGNGRLTKSLLKICKNVTYLDQEKNMIPEEIKSQARIINSSIQSFVDSNVQKYDFAFCQQAINYWLFSTNIEKFANIFNIGGQFVFNTFNKRPTKKIYQKEYYIDNLKYIEMSYRINKSTIQHIQMCEDCNPHFTQFEFISRKEYLKVLKPYFDIKIITQNRTDIYICTRRQI